MEDCIEKLQPLANKAGRPVVDDETIKVVRGELERLLLQAACNDFMRASNNMVRGKGARGLGLVALVARWGRYDVLERVLGSANHQVIAW